MTAGTEACDDGDKADGDGCTSNCSCGSLIDESIAFVVGRSCYVLVTKPQSWLDARGTCIQAGMDLATISTATDLTSVKPTIEGAVVWIGGNDIGTEGTFLWGNGESLTNTSDLWADQEPDWWWPEGEDCVAIETGGFYDRICGDKLHFLCER